MDDTTSAKESRTAIRRRTASPRFTNTTITTKSSKEREGGDNLKTKVKNVGTYVLTLHRNIHSSLNNKLIPELKVLYQSFLTNLKEEFPAWLSWKVIDILFYLVVGYLYQRYKWKLFRFMLEA